MDGGLSISGQSLHGRPSPRQAAAASGSGRANAVPAATRTSGSSSVPRRQPVSSAATAAARPQARAPANAAAATSAMAAASVTELEGGGAGGQYNRIVLRPGASAPVARRAPLSSPLPEPKTMSRGKVWNEDVEEAYRFQLAKFRDRTEYVHFHGGEEPDRWPNGMIKMLQLRSGFFYYYNRTRECANKDIHRTKLYAY